MSTSFYVQVYHSAKRRWISGRGDREWADWFEELERIRQSWKRAVNGMLTQLDREDPEIWHALGDAYERGLGVERNVLQAEMWLRMAAEAGNTNAMMRLGMLLGHYERSPDDRKESLAWYQRAADLGNSSGMVFLGFAYRDGDAVPVDERRAVEWFIKAHEAGAQNAAELAGRLLASNVETHWEAVKWLRIAAENGNDLAYPTLASIHENRRSPAHNMGEAFRCWLRVAERPRGDLRFVAMLRLACCSRDGMGTVRSHEQAKYWLDRIILTAPPQGAEHKSAVKLRQEIDEELL